MVEQPELSMEILSWVMKTISSVLLPIYLYHRSQDKKDKVQAKLERREMRNMIHNIELSLAEDRGKAHFINQQYELIPKLRQDVNHLFDLRRSGGKKDT